MEKICFIYIHGVTPDSQHPVKRGYSKDIHANVVAYLSKHLKTKLPRISRCEINWSYTTVGFKRQLAKLQFDQAPKRKGKPILRNALRDFIYPVALDVLYYVKNKGDEKSKGPMVIMEQLHERIEQAKKNGCRRVVIFAHSLGSVAAYDYIFRFSTRFAFPTGVELMSLITFGSPIGLFASSMGYPVSTKIKRKRYLKSWLNFWDHDDLIANRMLPHFPKKFSKGLLKDIPVDTAWVNPLKAHTRYWTKKKVHRQMAKELVAVL